MHQKTNETTLRSLTVNLISIIICLVLTCFGVLLIYHQDFFQTNIKTKEIIYSFGLSFINIGVVSFLYELYIRRTFKKIILAELRTTLDSFFSENTRPIIDEINSNTQKVVDSFEPPIYNRLKGSGIFDVFPDLNRDHQKRKFEDSKNAEFKFLKIYSTGINEYADKIIESINDRNCRYQIALVHPENLSALIARADSLPESEYADLKEEIHKNIKTIVKIYKSLDEPKKNNIELRYYITFISVALFGYNDTYQMGLYLHNRVSENGFQFKIRKIDDLNFRKQFSTPIKKHFESVWGKSLPHDLSKGMDGIPSLKDFENKDLIRGAQLN